ncbi:uncharacterized protein LOC142092998 [Calonectris borealis]|uniref:uncharacterized protein LOC142092998 n=1 Tax=Calonectris borealis TaxID=1323832 RepID=UPI003F4C3D14
MKMAGCRWLVPSVQGLLLCILALHLCVQDPLATAEHNAATNASVAANASVNSTEETPLTCQSFQCSGERCYQAEAHANETVTCHNETYCEGKVCAAFSCHGDGCFKGKTTVARCIVGHDFCEMKKMGLNYMAGCSRACKAAKPVCAGGMKAACYQECCPATLKASCLKLDGKVHVNSAGQVTPALLLKLVSCGVVLLLNYRVSASLWGLSSFLHGCWSAEKRAERQTAAWLL